MEPDQAHYDRAARRIGHWLLGFSVGGAVAAWIYGGWQWGLGFLVGAGASALNFRWLKQVAESLGSGGKRRPRARTAILMGLRYLLLATGAYVILRFSALSLPAALAGLFVAVAAVIFEILFELIYAGT